LSGALGAVVVVALAALLSAPVWLNADAVKARLLAQLQRNVPGELAYRDLELELFPRPGVTLAGLRWALPGRGEAQAARAEVRLAWLPLLAGNARIGAVQLRSPRLVLILQPAGPGGGRLTAAIVDARLRSALDRLAELAPDMDLEIADGELDLRPARGPALVLRNLDAALASRPDRIELNVRATSEPVERLTGRLRLAHAALEGGIELDLGGVRLAALQGFLPWQPDVYGIDGELDVRLLGTMRGASQLSVELDASAARLQLTAAGKPLTIEGAALKAVAVYASGNLNATLESLVSTAPSLDSKGVFSAGDDGYALRVQAARLALGEWWPLLERYAPKLAEAVRTHAVLRQGAIDSLDVSARADSLDQLWRPERLTAAAAFEHVALDLPRFGVAVRELAGKAAYADGALRIEGLQGAVGASRIRSASGFVQLTGPKHPLQGRVEVAVQLQEALRLARGALRGEPARHQLARVRRLEGRVLAQVELNGTLEAPLAAVVLSQPDFSVVHDAIPYALAVSAGSARYDRGVLSVQGLAGRLGGSTFSALTGRLALQAPYRLRLSGGRGDVALTELYRWLVRQPAIASRLDGYSVRGGRAAVSLASIEGALADPGRVRYRGELIPREVVIRARELEDTVRLDGGALRIEPEALTVADVNATALGSALRVGGRLERVENGYRLRRVEISGTLGRPLFDWLQARYDVPAQARPAVPLELERVRLELNGEEFAAQGAVQSQDGARLEFDIRSEADGRVALNRIALRDAQSDATVRATLRDRHVQAAFAGALAAASVRRLLPAAPVPFRTLSGDIAFDLDRDSPRASRALGRLQGEGLDAPLPATVPWRIERFSLEADGALLRIDSASIEGPGTQAVLSGTVASAEDRYLVDLLLQGKSLTATAWGGQKAEAGQAPASDAGAREALPRLLEADLPVWGSVRVNLDRFAIGQFEVMPLMAAGTLENGRLDLAVQRAALCGIALQARLAARPGQARLEGGLSSRGARLEESVPCLTERRVAATGGFDMDVRFTSEGPPGLLLDLIQGDFQFNARDGRILAFTTLNRVFAALNVTEAVRGRLPDLTREGMAFKSAQVKGRIDGSRLLFEDSVLDADTVTLAAQGQADLAARTLDLDLLVAPLKTVDAVVRRVPILGRVLGGTLVAIPVRVRGPVTDPAVVPLAPQAVAARLLGILGNTLKLPVDLFDALGAAGQAPQGGTR
jgi:uncharacterized protein involved in outer membrane biogenesis